MAKRNITGIGKFFDTALQFQVMIAKENIESWKEKEEHQNEIARAVILKEMELNKHGEQLLTNRDLCKLAGIKYNYFRDKYGVYDKYREAYLDILFENLHNQRHVNFHSLKSWKNIRKDRHDKFMTGEMIRHAIALHHPGTDNNSKIAKRVQCNLEKARKAGVHAWYCKCADCMDARNKKLMENLK